MHPLKRYLLVAFGLAALAGGAIVAEHLSAWRIEARGEAASHAAAERALGAVEQRVLALERELIQRAERIAAKPEVRQALLDPDLRERAVSAFRRTNLPEGYAAELYTPVPSLVAWTGAAVPFDPATRRLRFLSEVQSAVVSDGAMRDALVVWLPVLDDGGRLLGAVRVVRMLRVQVPVQNQYLQPFDILDRWSREQAAHVRVSFEPPGESAFASRGIQSVDGHPLLYLAAERPSLSAIVAETRSGFRDALAFFLALLLGWGVLGLVVLARGCLDRAQEHSSFTRVALAVGTVAGAVAAVIGFRYALLALGVPSRYVPGVPVPPAFDPAFLGSGFGGGIAGSVIELVITAILAAAIGAGVLYVGVKISLERRARFRLEGGQAGFGRWLGTAIISIPTAIAVLAFAASLIRRATEDATLGYFDRSGPLPEGLVVVAFGAFLLVSLAAFLVMTGIALSVGLRRRERAIGASVVTGVTLLIAFGWLGLDESLPLFIGIAVVSLAGMAASWIARRPERWVAAFSMRGVVLAALLLTVVTYPIVYSALQAKESARLIDAVEDFADGEDPRVAFALESVMLDARASEEVRNALSDVLAGRAVRPGIADSLAADLVTGSLLAALADYRVELTLHRPGGQPFGRYTEAAPVQIVGRVAPDPMPPDPAEFQRLRRVYEEEAAFVGFAVERRPAGERGSQYRYAGIGPVRSAEDGRLLGWITAWAEPRPARYAAETPFPRVLVPAGLYRLADEEWVFAEFLDSVIHRSRGLYFGRFRLPAEIQELEVGASRWRDEHLEGQAMRVLYWRVTDERVIAARVPATTLFDHLYFMLRILAAGLFLALLVFVLGTGIRRSSDVMPQRPRLRDRVLNRFLLVGLMAVLATGAIGREVIVTQNREAVEERLRRQLARVEATIYEDIGANVQEPVPPEYILDRARPDLMGPRLGLDVNIYRGADLVASSRSQLVRQRLIEPRLPVEAMQALFVDGERYAFVTERIGRFTYTTGFEAIPDIDGRPAVVIAVPTLPEQFAIEADEARMVAYLFGVLLLLLLVIFVIATVLANRLTRPFRRLREGLRAVGAGEAPAEPIPVERRDEVGEVIETFNAVWDQLEESRQKLAAHEREAAWREMARQVAHEIKNPLTPMKLSVQHLRRAYERAEATGADGTFAELLDQISGTLLEQIDALNRIAGEFSHFGRLPERDFEVFDLNESLRQAAALVGEEPQAEIALDLTDERLPVRADREELRRVYINLLKNAQQAIPEDEHGLITICSGRRTGDDGPSGAKEWAWSAVRDTGVGIPPDVQPRIFQPNFSTKTSGMGLGLAIARKAVEDLGGDISFETEPGVGTTFLIRLPLSQEEEAEAGRQD